MRREHHRRYADLRRDLYLPIRAGIRSCRSPRSLGARQEVLIFRCMSMPPRGGFVAPFVEPDLVWDFRIPARAVDQRLRTQIRVGAARRGLGGMARESDLPEDLIFYVNYLGGNMATFALNFSRPGGQIVSQYYLFLRLGREGYRRIQQNGYDTAQIYCAGNRKSGSLRTFVRRRQSQGHSRRLMDRSRPALSPTIHPCSICPSDCACAVGRWPPIRCCPTLPTSS